MNQVADVAETQILVFDTHMNIHLPFGIFVSAGCSSGLVLHIRHSS